jgi:multisubunit Na+/H+ antiporter MnhB subunit
VWEIILLILSLPSPSPERRTKQQIEEARRKRQRRIEPIRWMLYCVIALSVLLLLGALLAVWIAG